jgi:hypothetical protein
MFINFLFFNICLANDLDVLKALPSLKKGPNISYSRFCPSCSITEQTLAISDINPITAKIDSPSNSQKIELSILTLDRAQELFNKLASNKDIPFTYAKDGCFARAHKMAMLLDEEKIISGKAFMQGKFFAQTISGPAFWTYHVAPIVLVKVGEELKPYIFDPSMFNRPVTMAEWKKGLSRSTRSIFLEEYITNRFSYDLNDKDKAYDAYSEVSINSMNAENKKNLDQIGK